MGVCVCACVLVRCMFGCVSVCVRVGVCASVLVGCMFERVCENDLGPTTVTLLDLIQI